MKNVWIVDDDDIYQFIMKVNIGKLKQDINVKSFTNGKDFMEEVKKTMIDKTCCPDVIFIDINMPLMDGWEILDKIKDLNCSELFDIKIFVCSSSIENNDIEKANSYSFITKYLVKPISLETLSSIIL